MPHPLHRRAQKKMWRTGIEVGGESELVQVLRDGLVPEDVHDALFHRTVQATDHKRRGDRERFVAQ